MNDLNTNQVVSDSGVVGVPPAPTGVNQEPAIPATSVQTPAPPVTSPDAPGAQVLADGTEANKPIPYDRFAEVNAAKKAAEDRIAQLEQHIQLMRANPPQQATGQQQPQPTQQSLTMQVMKELGLDPENILTGAEQARVIDEVSRRMAVAAQSQAQTQSFIAAKSDFSKVVGAQDPITGQFVFAPPIQRIVQNNPGLLPALQGALSRNVNEFAVLAYELASKDPQYIAEVEKAKKLAMPSIPNLPNPNMRSVSTVAGSGIIDRAAAIRAMSDEEFKAYKQRVMQTGG